MPSFDIVAKVAWNEIDNALNQASKEIAQRFDFKGTKAELEKTSEGLQAIQWWKEGKLFEIAESGSYDLIVLDTPVAFSSSRS